MNQTMKPPMPKKRKSNKRTPSETERSVIRQRMSGRDGNSAMMDTAEQPKNKSNKRTPSETERSVIRQRMSGSDGNYAAGGKLEMVEKDGKKVPFYAADDKGKMKKGGKVSEAKKEAKKAVKKHEDKMHKNTKKMASGGKVRGAGMAKKGVRPCKMR